MEMILPASYAPIEQEEMMYLDGGITTSRKWYGTQVKFTNTERRAIVNILSGVAATAAVFSSYMALIAAGASVATFGLSVATAGVIAAWGGMATALAGVGAWYFSNYSTVNLPGVWG